MCFDKLFLHKLFFSLIAIYITTTSHFIAFILKKQKNTLDSHKM